MNTIPEVIDKVCVFIPGAEHSTGHMIQGCRVLFRLSVNILLSFTILSCYEFSWLGNLNIIGESTWNGETYANIIV